jgi:hypothetical protein
MKQTAAQRRTVVRLTGAAVGIALVGPIGVASSTTQAAQEETAFTVRIENVSTPETLETADGETTAVPLSPGVYTVHPGPSPLFVPGQADLGAGLESLAEDGSPDSLAASLGEVSEFAPSGTFATPVGKEEPGPIGPGGVYEFQVRGGPGDRLSFATMFVASNDLFYAPSGEGIALFDEGDDPTTGDVTDQVALWDAGTEVNQEPGAGSDQAPSQPAPDTGPSEDEPVREIDDVDDGYAYPAVPDVIGVTLSS